MTHPPTEFGSLTVVRGCPDDAELAAVTAALILCLRRGERPAQARETALAHWTVKGGGRRRTPARPRP
ncbi:acyl-CoA carboxylase subunit epsilon [Streptomyces sp. NPDC051561]|uniref:acyl-CoA carboxylase subunit epsilon n=1 Tax=Streptomyces sp. NPDC051561 TaxID=3365658 RepID=UPI0037949298